MEERGRRKGGMDRCEGRETLTIDSAHHLVRGMRQHGVRKRKAYSYKSLFTESSKQQRGGGGKGKRGKKE